MSSESKEVQRCNADGHSSIQMNSVPPAQLLRPVDLRTHILKALDHLLDSITVAIQLRRPPELKLHATLRQSIFDATLQRVTQGPGKLFKTIRYGNNLFCKEVENP